MLFVCHYLHSILSITICNLLIESPSYLTSGEENVMISTNMAWKAGTKKISKM